MKILVYANNCPWQSWHDKTSFLRDYFKPLVDMEFNVQYSSFQNVPVQEYVDSENKKYMGINFEWYDTNLTKPAKALGYDGVIFTQSFNEWQGFPAMGYTNPANLGIGEIAIGSDEHDLYNFQGKRYAVFKDRWTESARHEMFHFLCWLYKIPDKVHYYYSIGQIDLILQELMAAKKPAPVPTTTMTYKYFTAKEVSGLKPELIKILDIARGLSGTAYKITSGYRSPQKNKEVGGVPNSSHTKGLAVDLACTDNTKRTLILRGLYNCGSDLFIEICKSHIHIDIDSSIHKLGQTMWANDD